MPSLDVRSDSHTQNFKYLSSMSTLKHPAFNYDQVGVYETHAPRSSMGNSISFFFLFLCSCAYDGHTAKDEIRAKNSGLALGLLTLADDLWLLGAWTASRDELVFYKGTGSAMLDAGECVPHFYLSFRAGKGWCHCSHSRFTVNCVNGDLAVCH